MTPGLTSGGEGDNTPERYRPPAASPATTPATPAAPAKTDAAEAAKPAPLPALRVPERPLGYKRSSEEIRQDIEIRRQELGRSVEALRDQVAYLTDWRGHVRRHKKPVAITVAATGFAIGGIIAAALRRK